MKQPNILVLVSRVPKDKTNSLNYGKFQKKLQDLLAGEAQMTVAALKEFRFEIGVKDTKAWIPERNLDVRDFDLVVFRLWSNEPERASVMVHYLRSQGIRYTDSSAGVRPESKAACAMVRWAAGISVPATIFGTHQLLKRYARNPDPMLIFPSILKSVSGRKGRDNYLIHSPEELNGILDKASNRDKDFILQQYIPNDGDYRFLVLGRYIRCVIRRQSSSASHLTNTSRGGKTELIDTKQFSRKVIRDVLKTVSLAQLEMAGVDIIFDKTTNRHYILEANRAPQLLTGAFTEEKTAAFARFLKSQARQAITYPQKLIGRRITVTLPDLGLERLPGKVDTGAYSCSLHAEDIEETRTKSTSVLHFTVIGSNGQRKRCSSSDYKIHRVRSSNGELEQRYVINTTLIIDGRGLKTKITLTNRQSMRYPLLLGRRLLRQNFIVDVSKSEGAVP